ncbi:hypothetical protein, partial [Mycobacterium tuberculosis]
MELQRKQWEYNNTKKYLAVMGIHREGLYELSEEQARAILDLKLQHLVKLESAKIENEMKELKSSIEYCNSILSSRDMKRA